MQKRTTLGEILLENHIITPEQLELAISMQKNTDMRLGEALVELKIIDEDALLKIIAQQLHISFVDLSKYPIKNNISSILPESYARQYKCILLEDRGDNALVGMIDPSDIIAFDEIRRILKKHIDVAIVRKKDLEKHLGFIYRRVEDISNSAGELGSSIEQDARIAANAGAVPAEVIDAPVRRFIQALFEDAIQINASDIHIEPDENILRIRLRVDGVLQEQILDRKNIAAAVAQRLKLMANLNMSERRLPLDGRFTFTVNNKLIDVRLSTMPNEHGESVVMRLLDQSDARIDLNKCGMPAPMLMRFRKLIHNPRGMILVTGPTGSGKTSTLYGALSEINAPGSKIITIEDPVEYKMERVCQVQVRPKIGLDFALVLRSALRQDPDIILVGEMRDQETASIAMRAALTGHLVLSTLHTNDSATTAIRLLDMGVPGYLIAATLQCVIAQRLIRKICDYCKEPYKPDNREKEWLRASMGESFVHDHYFIGKGCVNCNNIGYSGRTGIYEFLVFSDEMISALSRENETEFMKESKNNLKGVSLLDEAMVCAINGVTTVYEVMRVVSGVF